VLGDVIPAGQGSEFFPNVLNLTANDSACGLGGLVAALLTSYQLYE
jgi:peroxin-11B